MNPTRLAVFLLLPQQDNVNLKLRGIVDVAKSKVQMIGIKVEITLIKAELSLWPKLDFPSEKKPSSGQVQKQLEEDRKGSDGGFGLGRGDLDDIPNTNRIDCGSEVKGPLTR